MERATSKRLGDILNFKRGYDLPSYKRKDGPYPIISSGGISGYHSDFKATGEGLITGRYGTLGEVYYVDGNYWPHNTALYVTDFKGNHPKYVYYLLKILGNLQSSDKSTVPGINRNDLHETKVPYLPIEFQQKIASILSAIDDKIELNNKINAELEGMAKLIYDYWFVQFDFPFDFAQGKPANETSDPKDVKPYKSSGGKMVWNKELKREVPEGWGVKKLENLLVEFTKGITTSYVNKSSLINLNQKVNKGFKLDRQYFKFLDEAIEIPETKFAKQKDILINSLGQGTLGRVHFFLEKSNNIVVDQHLFILRADLNLVSPSYLYLTLTSTAYQLQIERQITGSTGMQMLNASNLKDIKIILPNFHISSSFENLIFKLFQKVSINEQQNQKLSALRDWLLPMLMNGQVRVEGKYEVEDGEIGMAAEPEERYGE